MSRKSVYERSKPILEYPEGPPRNGSNGYVVELYRTPRGIYVKGQWETHGCLVRWPVMRRELKRYDRLKAAKADAGKTR